MNLSKIVPVSFFISLAITVFAAYLKLTHVEGADTWLTICLIAILVFVVSVLLEIWSSNKINHSEKVMWTLALIFFNTLAGLIYMLLGRKRITNA